MKIVNTVQKVLLFVCIFFASTSLHAQGSFEFLHLDYHTNISNNSDLEFNDFDARASVPVIIRKKFFMLAAPNYRRTSIDNLGFSIPSHTLTRLDVPFIMQKPLSKKKSLGGLIDIGISSDFEDITPEDFNFLAGIFVSHNGNPRFQYRYGLIYGRLINGNIIFPLFSFTWLPTNRLRIDASNPVAPNIKYTFSPSLQAGIAFESDGGLYKLSEDAGSRYVEDRRSELAPYVDLAVLKNWVLHAKAGYTFNRNIKLYKNVDAGRTWYESFKDTDPIAEDKTKGWFFEVGIGLKIKGNR